MKIKNFLKELVVLTFVVFAFACSSSEDDNGGGSGGTGGNDGDTETSLTITSSKDELFNEDNVYFFVNNNNGMSVTGASVVYIDGTAISGSSHAFITAGMHTIYAKKGDLQSPEITVQSVASTHTTKVMVEDYTGTWCGYCPRLATALENTVNLNSNIIPVAIHSGDVMEPSFTNQLESTFGINSWPNGKVNRTITWNESTNQPISYLSTRQNMGLAINSSIAGNTISAEVKVHYDLKVTSANRIVVYLLENGLVYNQVNYYNGDSSSAWYQAGNPIVGFVHDHTARAIFTDVMGDTIPAADTTTGSTHTANYTLTVPSSVQNTANLELVAFVVGPDNKVLNVQKASLGENKDFD